MYRTPAIPVILTLTGQYLAAGRDEEAYSYFRERAAAAWALFTLDHTAVSGNLTSTAAITQPLTA